MSMDDKKSHHQFHRETTADIKISFVTFDSVFSARNYSTFFTPATLIEGLT